MALPELSFSADRPRIKRNDFHARMFAPSFGVREDPATGSAAAAFAGFCAKSLSLGDGEHRFVIEQGFEMGRPSLIELGVTMRDGTLASATVGGPAIIVTEGTHRGVMRSLLFVPADSAEKLDKAMTSGADALIVDLEDFDRPRRQGESARQRGGIPQGGDGRGVAALTSWCASTGCNRPDRCRSRCRRAGKARRHHAAEGGRRRVRRARRRQARGARGDRRPARRPRQDRRASPPKPRPALFVTGTFAGCKRAAHRPDLGRRGPVRRARREANRDAQGRFLDPYRLARALCLAGAAAAEVPALDTVYVDFRNNAGFRRECEEARRDGFVGKMAIHPAQVPIINEVFTPTRGGARAAQSIVAAFAAKPGAGVVGIDGVMYDRPHLARARRLLARAEAAKAR